jgi:1-acyl-sn-glycerol-3-phosphate acyltransferase
MLYRLMRFFVGIGIRVFYKKIRIIDSENLSVKGPKIIIANHPNTLMDAWVVGFVSKQPIYFMAKASLFDSSFRIWLLKKMNMIPVNRAGEGKVKGVDNNQVFEECYKLLEANKTIVIFPEGSSFNERILRKLKTGTARIALDAEVRNEGKLGVNIIPMGINYSHPDRFRSSILVAVGSPITLTEFIDDYKVDFIPVARKVTELFRTKLEELLITTEDKQQDYLLENVRDILTSRYITNESDEFLFLRKIRDSLYGLSIHSPEELEKIRRLVQRIKWKSTQLAIKTDFLDRRFRSLMFFRQLMFSVVALLIALPIFIYGAFHNIIQYKLTDKLIPMITKEVEYFAPLAVLLGLILYPLSYFGFVVLLHQLVHLPWWAKVIYFSSMPITGLVAYYLNRYYTHIAFKWRYLFLMWDNNSVLLNIKKHKQELRDKLGL